MKFYEDRTMCDCGELLFDKRHGDLFEYKKNYLYICEDGKSRCANCLKVYTREQVEF